ncbi:hypothetical protein MJO28_011843 [Puccinia striiformis f. sp. tritici]|uniref:Uncharacterized protein n=1 Tax=Puccinia striiformis f. sp. tritici TaxID=168172 RepID=A0ACC0E3T7_9BASI|nr:hypothetical protein MJO28_011843 [Puccinia striiformis f. sp. tritici]
MVGMLPHVPQLGRIRHIVKNPAPPPSRTPGVRACTMLRGRFLVNNQVNNNAFCVIHGYLDGDTADSASANRFLGMLGLVKHWKRSKPNRQAKRIEEEVEWSTRAVQNGFNEPYQRHDLIVKPALETLQTYQKQWDPARYQALYTSIIAPTMSGTTRLLIELAKEVCVVYICLGPPRSIGQPPRSRIALMMLPNTEDEFDLLNHYTYLLAVIFKAVTEFFGLPEIRSRNREEKLAAWFEYSFQIDERKQHKFAMEVKEAMKIQDTPR